MFPVFLSNWTVIVWRAEWKDSSSGKPARRMDLFQTRCKPWALKGPLLPTYTHPQAYNLRKAIENLPACPWPGHIQAETLAASGTGCATCLVSRFYGPNSTGRGVIYVLPGHSLWRDIIPRLFFQGGILCSKSVFRGGGDIAGVLIICKKQCLLRIRQKRSHTTSK